MKNSKNMDSQSESLLTLLAAEQGIRARKVPGVRTVLVVLSSRGMVFDKESLRQKVLLTYPEAAVFFVTTMGKPVGPVAPRNIDLIIDFTGPGQRQSMLYAKKLRRMARVVIGRNAGLFRKRIYDRIFNEKSKTTQLPPELLTRERLVQRAVLELAGIPMAQSGDTPLDRGLTIALDLPLLSKL